MFVPVRVTGPVTSATTWTPPSVIRTRSPAVSPATVLFTACGLVTPVGKQPGVGQVVGDAAGAKVTTPLAVTVAV